MGLRIVVFLLPLLMLPSWLSAAQVDYFLKLDGVPGESTDPEHLFEIDVLSWSWGETRECADPPASPTIQSITISKLADVASPTLALACATGQHIPEAKLTCRKAGGAQEEYLIIKFSDLVVSSYQTGGSSNDVLPTDQVSFCFGGIRITNLQYDTEGNLIRVVTEGFPTVPGGIVPPPDDYPIPPSVTMDQITVTGPEAKQALDQTE